MNKDELKEILRLHKLWLNTESEHGDQADLEGADLEGANLEGADLDGANLEGANLQGADLQGADLQGADLKKAHLEGANLEGANLQGADLQGADLKKAHLEGANLEGANLQGADLQGADLQGADLKKAHLEGANLEGADLKKAHLQGANLEEANLQGANLQGANIVGTILDVEVLEQTAYGESGRAIRRAKGAALPIKAGRFKELWPVEYDTVKQKIAGRVVTPEVLDELIEAFGLKWVVTSSTYKSKLQRLGEEPNDVLLLNVQMSSLTSDEHRLKHLRAIKDTSKRSGHPVAYPADLMTMGWVRYNIYPAVEGKGVLLVEEVQSDIHGVRKGLKDPQFREQLAARGMSAQDVEDTVALLEPFAVRFYEDALDLVFQIAHDQSLDVEMLTYETKKQFGSPQAVYTELPRSMGMRKRQQSVAMPELPEVWHAVPNRRR